MHTSKVYVSKRMKSNNSKHSQNTTKLDFTTYNTKKLSSFLNISAQPAHLRRPKHHPHLGERRVKRQKMGTMLGYHDSWGSFDEKNQVGEITELVDMC
jgi:hypothetical protein